ncbi:MAG: DUF4290 domain-containing protein [Bacteroidales bacterium]|jgi:hypothetical protein|nr:DUF4290 domain-containing protein [Bacteroidales bacterium]
MSENNPNSLPEYNTTRNKLIIKEYGRNVQKMIEKAVQIEDYAQRTEAAKAIVKTMSLLNPENAEQNKSQNQTDYWHKLWDHLFIISDYQLDVDSPFPKPEIKKTDRRSFVSEYSKGNIGNRSYGRNVVNVINALAELPDSPVKSMMGANLANHLKKLYLTWNKTSVDDEVILKQFEEMSQGKIKLPENFQLESTRDILANNNFVKNNNAKNGNGKKSKRKKRKKEQGI